MPDRQYTDPRLAALYDLGNGAGRDRDFYESLAGPQPQNVLELGCGTGWLCHIYARKGHRVVGVDPAKAMLNVAKEKPNGDQIEWVLACAESYVSDQRFDLIIMTGHAFQCLLSDAQISNALATMRRHLKPTGRVVFESRNPAIDWDRHWAREVRLETETGPVMCRRRMLENDAPDELSFAWDYEIGEETITSRSTLRFASCEKIITLADAVGLSLVTLFGDWSEAAFCRNSSQEMIFTFCRKTGC